MEKGYVKTNTRKRVVWANCRFLLLISANVGFSEFSEFTPVKLYNQLGTSGNAQKTFKDTFVFSI